MSNLGFMLWLHMERLRQQRHKDRGAISEMMEKYARGVSAVNLERPVRQSRS